MWSSLGYSFFAGGGSQRCALPEETERFDAKQESSPRTTLLSWSGGHFKGNATQGKRYRRPFPEAPPRTLAGRATYVVVVPDKEPCGQGSQSWSWKRFKSSRGLRRGSYGTLLIFGERRRGQTMLSCASSCAVLWGVV